MIYLTFSYCSSSCSSCWSWWSCDKFVIKQTNAEKKKEKKKEYNLFYIYILIDTTYFNSFKPIILVYILIISFPFLPFFFFSPWTITLTIATTTAKYI